jgi:hypothetical protein
MQDLAACEKCRERRTTRGCNPKIAGHAERSKGENGKARDDGRDAEILVVRGFACLVPGKDCRERDEARDQHGIRRERLGQGRDNTAEQSRYAECTNAGCAAAIGRIALSPASLQPNEQSYRQGDPKLGYERIHDGRLRWRRSAWRGFRPGSP